MALVANRRLKIALLTACDAHDRRSWSGTHYYIAQALQKHCGDVCYLGPVKARAERLGKFYNSLAKRFLGKRYDHTHSLMLAKNYAEIFQAKLAAEPFDIIVAPAGSTEIAFLETDIPIIYLSDTTFALVNDYYPEFSKFLQTSVYQANLIEKQAIAKASLILYPSETAKESAVKDYDANPEKVYYVPFGANVDIENLPNRDAVLAKRKSSVCRLLFLGVDWQRKGGEIAFETLLDLERMGIPAQLTVCGCVPPKGFKHPALTVIPFLNKKDPAQRTEFSRLLLNSDFLLLPTRSESYGIVFCEASAFGLPSITTDTGGISGAVANGENGFRLPLEAPSSVYAEKIAEIYQNDAYYYHLVRSSRDVFEKKLNWDAWGINVQKLMDGLLQK